MRQALPKAIINWIEGKDFDIRELEPVYGLTFAKCDYLVDMSSELSVKSQNTMKLNKNNIKRIAVYGAGGLGREVAGGINRINKANGDQWEFVGFFDDNIPAGTQVSHFGKVIGGMDDLNKLDEPMALAIAVGQPRTRKLIRESITNPNITFPNLIAPSFRVLDKQTFEIGEGNKLQCYM